MGAERKVKEATDCQASGDAPDGEINTKFQGSNGTGGRWHGGTRGGEGKRSTLLAKEEGEEKEEEDDYPEGKERSNYPTSLV